MKDDFLNVELSFFSGCCNGSMSQSIWRQFMVASTVCLKLHLGVQYIAVAADLVLKCGFKCNQKELRAILWDANELLREARNNGGGKV